MIDLISSIASLHFAASGFATVTTPSSSTLISHSVSSIIFLMFLPPGPIRAPILLGLICKLTMRGAYLDISFGSGNASFISPNICILPVCACARASVINSKETPSIFKSSWMAVIPSLVPATLKSISPKWSSAPRISLKIACLSPSRTNPMAIPAT